MRCRASYPIDFVWSYLSVSSPLACDLNGQQVPIGQMMLFSTSDTRSENRWTKENASYTLLRRLFAAMVEGYISRDILQHSMINLLVGSKLQWGDGGCSHTRESTTTFGTISLTQEPSQICNEFVITLKLLEDRSHISNRSLYRECRQRAQNRSITNHLLALIHTVTCGPLIQMYRCSCVSTPGPSCSKPCDDGRSSRWAWPMQSFPLC